MYYSEQFKQKAKQAYPDSDDLHERINDGQTIVGRYLSDSLPALIMSLDDILVATDLETLQRLAREKKKSYLLKKELLDEWNTLHQEQVQATMM